MAARGLRKMGRGASVLALLALVAACGEREVVLPGERFDLRTPLDASLPVEGAAAPVDTTGIRVNSAAPISLPPATANAEWTHRGGNVRHQQPHGALSATPARVWSVAVGEGNSRRNRIAATPVAADGRIFTMDALAGVTAVSAEGGVLWQRNLAAAGSRSAISGGGLAIGEGLLVISTGYGEVVALDPASGNEVWRQDLGAPANGAPAVSGGTVYVVGRDSAAWAIRASDGRILWQQPGAIAQAGTLGAAAPAVGDRTVILPFPSGQVTAALKSSGIPLWTTAVAGQRQGRAMASLLSDISGDPLIAGPVTYIGNTGGRIVAFDSRDGSRVWTADEAALGPMVLAGGALFVLSDDARLVRLDARSGERVWSVELPYFVNERLTRRKGVTAHYGPVLAGGRIAVASGDGLLRFFDPVDGALVGTAEIPGGAASGPILAGGALYVMGGTGELHAFR